MAVFLLQKLLENYSSFSSASLTKLIIKMTHKLLQILRQSTRSSKDIDNFLNNKTALFQIIIQNELAN